MAFAPAVASLAMAQRSAPDTLVAIRVHEPVLLDGSLDEGFWASATWTVNFTQRDPREGQPATDRTEVAAVYDEHALYFGARLYTTNPDREQAKYMQRDFAYWTDDNFQFIISTFNDRRTGYLFVTNPHGARADMIIGSRDERNMDWNGVWDVRTARTDEGWTAEFRIPWTTLQFPRDTAHVWGLNFERNVRWKNEQTNWQGWGRNTSVENLATAGTLAGIGRIGYARRFELKPYLLGGIARTSLGDEPTGKPGADLNVNVTPTLKLNLTTNTDFAQVEVDRTPVNLTRFNFFFPEKREFFLEGSRNYEFGLYGSDRLFYTRRIGIENEVPVPVLGGARLFGKIGPHNIGALNIQTGSAEGVPGTNNTVLRYRRDLGEQSFVGGLFTGKFNREGNGQVMALDGGFGSSRFLGNKVLEMRAHAAQSFTDGFADDEGFAAGISGNYPNDIMQVSTHLGTVRRGFDPGLGFLARSDYEVGMFRLGLTPRWFRRYGVRKMLFTPVRAELYRDPGTGHTQTLDISTRPFGVFLESGDEVGLTFQWAEDNVPETFRLADTIPVAPGHYAWHGTSANLTTFRGRRVQLIVTPTWGTFYQGRKTTVQGTVNVNLGRHLNVGAEHIWNRLVFPGGEGAGSIERSTHELALYPVCAITTRLTVSVFGQWNSLSDLVRVNARVHWIPKIGTDVFLVYDEGHSPVQRMDFSRPAFRTAVGKVVWRFTF